MGISVRAAEWQRADKSSENSDKSSEISEARRLVHISAEPRQPDDSKKAAIVRAARALGLPITWPISTQAVASAPRSNGSGYKTAVDLRTGRPIILRERARIIERSY